MTKTALGMFLALTSSLAAGCKDSTVRTVFDDDAKAYAQRLGRLLVFDETRFGPFAPQAALHEKALANVFNHGEKIFRQTGSNTYRVLYRKKPSRAYREIAVFVVSKGKLASIRCSSPACKTKAGIGVSSEYKALKSAYSDLACDFSQANNSQARPASRPNNSGKALCKSAPKSRVTYVIQVAVGKTTL
jgi:hypothetical protein